MPTFDLTRIAEFSDKFAPRILHQDERAKVVLVCLSPGQRIPPHKEPNQGVFTVLEGSGTLSTDEGELPLRARTVVVVPHGGTRGLRADSERLMVLATAIA